MGLADLDAFLDEQKKGAPTSASPAAAPAEGEGGPGWLERTTQRGLERGKEIATFPIRTGRLVAGIDKPQNIEDYAVMALGNAPLIATGGGAVASLVPSLPRLAPALGRVATAIGLAKGRGEENSAAAMEGLGAVGAEGAMALGSKLLASPAKALTAIRDRIGAGPQGATNLGVFDRLINFWQAAPTAAEKAVRATGSPGRPGAPGTILGITRYLDDVDPTGVSSRMFREEVMRGTRLWPLRATLPAASPGVSRAAEAATGPLATSAADAAISSNKTAPPMAAELLKIGLSPVARAANRIID